MVALDAVVTYEGSVTHQRADVKQVDPTASRRINKSTDGRYFDSNRVRVIGILGASSGPHGTSRRPSGREIERLRARSWHGVHVVVQHRSRFAGHVGQGHALDVAHGEVVDAVHLAEPVDRREIEVRRDRRFPTEPPYPVRIIGKVGVEHLQRNDPAKGDFARLPDRAEPAASQALDDLEITEPSRGRRICLHRLSGRPRCVVPPGTTGLARRIGNSQVGNPCAW